MFAAAAVATKPALMCPNLKNRQDLQKQVPGDANTVLDEFQSLYFALLRYFRYCDQQSDPL
jgi:hypothetical protein